MRKILSVAAAAWLATASGALAQQDVVPATATGSVDLGMRFTDVTGDAARYQRFRDVRDGALIDRFRIGQRGQSWTFDGGVDHLGRGDQRLFGELRAAGRVKLSFTWDQVPLFISGDTRTPFRVEAPGVLRLDDGLQLGVETGALRVADIANTASAIDVRSHRYIGAFNFLYTPTREIDVRVKMRYTERQGTMPMGASFGFSNAVEVAAPIDTRTTDLNAGVEWATDRGMVRIGYDGSWFDNRISTLVWDSPLKLTDATASNAYSTGLGGSQGRAALPPSNTLQAVTTAASLALPAKSRMTASLMAGAWRQNEALLPTTINTAIPVTPLPRATAEASAHTMALNYTFTSRPAPYLWLNARYRYYDFDNRTPIFEVPEFVVLDQSTHVGEPTEPLGYKRQNLDVDAAFTPRSFTIRTGYSRSLDHRTFRIFERTVEDAYRASIDTTRLGWVLVRGLVERSERRGSGFDEELLVAVGEQPDMRHFDVADRNRTRVTGLLQVAPIKTLGLSLSAATGRDEYGASGFGLRDSDNRSISTSVDFAPTPAIAASLWYTNERYTALQNSRTATPGTSQVTDPTRDWSTDSADRVNTVAGSLDLVKALPRTDVQLTFSSTRSKAVYLYRVPADSTIAALVQLPAVRNDLQTATGDVRFHLSRRVAIGVLYWYDRYSVDNFALSPSTFNTISPPASLFLGYVYRPYTANAAALRLLCTW